MPEILKSKKSKFYHSMWFDITSYRHLALDPDLVQSVQILNAVSVMTPSPCHTTFHSLPSLNSYHSPEFVSLSQERERLLLEAQ